MYTQFKTILANPNLWFKFYLQIIMTTEAVEQPVQQQNQEQKDKEAVEDAAPPPAAPVEEPAAPVEERPAPVEEPPAPVEEPPAPVEEPPAPAAVVPEPEPVAAVPQGAGGSGTESDSDSMPDLEDDAARQSQSAVSRKSPSLRNVQGI